MDPTSGGAGQTMEEVRAMPAIPLPDLLAYFDAVRAVTRHYLEQATEAELAQEYPPPRVGPRTGTWIVGHILVEARQHTGQVALLRGMMRGMGASSQGRTVSLGRGAGGRAAWRLLTPMGGRWGSPCSRSRAASSLWRDQQLYQLAAPNYRVQATAYSLRFAPLHFGFQPRLTRGVRPR